MSEVAWVIGCGPSRKIPQVPKGRIIAVNHACHDFPDADIVYSKDLGMWKVQHGCPTCCVDLPQRTRSHCMYSTSGDLSEWATILPGVHVIREQQRRPGFLGVWPDSFREGLVTCGNSGIGALCLADLLTYGTGVIHLWGLDMFDHPYSRWAGWFVTAGYTRQVRSRVIVHGDTALDPEGVWERV